MVQQITRGDYLKDLITINVHNNTETELTDLYSKFIFQCGDDIQKFLDVAPVIKISFDETESLKLGDLNVCYLAGITIDGHKETFQGSISFNTRGEVVYWEPTPSTVTPSSTSDVETTCGCANINGYYSNCSQSAIVACFTLNYAPSRLSQLKNDTDFQSGTQVAETISIHNSTTEAHPYIQSLISSTTETINNRIDGVVEALDNDIDILNRELNLETSLRVSATEGLQASIQAETTAREEADSDLQIQLDNETSLRISATEGLQASIQAETTAREEAISLAISTTEGTTSESISIHNSTTEAHPYIQSLISSTTETINNNLEAEITARENADNNLQAQIDVITLSSDVTDVVGTYAQLQAYDTSTLSNNNIIKVLQDETHENETTYYRWIITNGVGAWVLIGEEGPYYTIASADETFVKQTTTVNGKPLNTNITITATEVGALPSTTTINDLTTEAQQNALNSGATQNLINQITTNKNNIATNTSAIASNTSAIKLNTSVITTNTSNIAANTSAIASNTTDIATNTSVIASNTSAINNHISNTSNPHSVTKSQVGLGNVDNTSDLNKPISTATQTALNAKVNTTDFNTALATKVNTSDLTTALALKANVGLDNLDSEGVDVINQSKGLLTGELSSVANVLSDVKYYAHSNFDLSKFTVVGSPNITDDGILTAAQQGYVSFTGIDLASADTWKIKGSFIAQPQSASYVEVIFTQTTNYGVQFYKRANTQYVFQGSINSTTWTWTYNVNYNFVDGQKYYYEIEFTGSAYNLNISTDNVNFTTISTYATASKLAGLTSSAVYAIGSSQLADRYWHKPIDLKDFSIIANGYPVFSGCKTGLDTILEDNYAVVGTPTITNGVISNCSATSGVLSNVLVDFTQYESWELTIPVRNNGTKGHTQVVFHVRPTEYQSGWNTNQASIDENNHLQWSVWSTPAGDATNRFVYYYNSSPIPIQNNTNYWVKYKFTGTQYLIGASTDGENYTWQVAATSTTKCGAVGYFEIGIKGIDPNYAYAMDVNAINLSGITFVANGKAIDLFGLKVPYTLSKTGSKIVDSIFRDNVQRTYEVKGQANYYTLNEGVNGNNGNFTLPMGEVYGMIGGKVNREQWQYGNSRYIIAYGVDIPIGSLPDEYDLSDFLPNDGEVYEVLFNGVALPAAIRQKYVNLYLYTSVIGVYCSICSGRSQVDGISAEGSGALILPVGSDRKVYVQPNQEGGNAGGTYRLYAVAYRKAG